MKMVKSLILGSAAGLIAMSGAQAADLPVKAKAVEYVRICSLYGAGFYYIPGTDTCIKLGGYLRVDIAVNTNSDFSGAYTAPAAAARTVTATTITARSRRGPQHRYAHRDRVRRGPHLLRCDVQLDHGYVDRHGRPSTRGTFAPDTLTGIAGSDTLGVYYAFIQFAGFTMGKADFPVRRALVNYPGNNFDGLVGGGGDVTGVNQLTYTAQFGNGVSGAISACRTSTPTTRPTSVTPRSQV